MPALKTNPDGTPHVHQYIRAKKPNGQKDPNRLRCAHPLCTHWAYKVDLEGKKSLCAVCGLREITLNYDALQRSRPPCFQCSNSKKAAAVRDKFAVLDEMFGESA